MGSIIMPEISKEETMKAVERYKRGETSQKAEAKKQGVSHQTFQDWIRRYETFGSDGFGNTGNRQYPSALKESAVKAYLNGEGSHAEICKKYGISSRTQLRNWIKVYFTVTGDSNTRASSSRRNWTSRECSKVCPVLVDVLTMARWRASGAS